MLKHISHPVIVAGLASVLAFGAVGCKSESYSTTEVSTTDENGNTTTTTTTTKTDESGNQTTETTEVTTDANGNVVENADATEDPNDFNGYINDYYKIGLKLPEGFAAVEDDEDLPDDMKIDFHITNADDSAVATIALQNGVTQNEGITDCESWAEAAGTNFANSLIDAGVTGLEPEVLDFSVGGIPYGKVCMMSGTDSQGQGIYYDLYFILDDDGDGMLIYFYAQDEDTIQSLRDNLVAL